MSISFGFDQLVTLVGIVIGIITFVWGVTSYQNQMNAQLFLEFTRRFEEVMQSFPKNAWAARVNSEESLPEESEELSLSVLRYLNLCGEEYYLYRKGWLDRRMWALWKDELNRTMRTPLFVREWKKLSKEFDTHPEFKKYVESAQASSDGQKAR